MIIKKAVPVDGGRSALMEFNSLELNNRYLNQSPLTMPETSAFTPPVFHHNQSSVQFSLTQHSRPLTGNEFLRFPNPLKISENELSQTLPSSVLLQPRIHNGSRRSRHFVPNEHKDDYYWQRRKKNNEAARRSREKRRTIDSVLERKVLLLSQENELLRNQLYEMKLKYGEIDTTNVPDTVRNDANSNMQTYISPLLQEGNDKNILDAISPSAKLTAECGMSLSSDNVQFIEKEVPVNEISASKPQNDILSIYKSGQSTAVNSQPPSVNHDQIARNVDDFLTAKQHESANSAQLVLSDFVIDDLTVVPVDLTINSNFDSESTKSPTTLSSTSDDTKGYPNDMDDHRNGEENVKTRNADTFSVSMDRKIHENGEMIHACGYALCERFCNGAMHHLPHKLRFKSCIK